MGKEDSQIKEAMSEWEREAAPTYAQYVDELDADLRQFSAENADRPVDEVAANLLTFWSREVEEGADPLTQEDVDVISERVSAGGVVFIRDSILHVSDPGEDV